MLLPIVEEYNIPACPERFAELAKIMGENTDGLSTRDAAELSIKAMRQMCDDCGIHAQSSQLVQSQKTSIDGWKCVERW